MKLESEVVASNTSGFHFPVSLKMHVGKEKCHLQIIDNTLGNINLEANDFFNCLVDLRLILEKKNLFLLCKGSMKNVNVSRMSSQMGHGVKAYYLEMGQSASLKNMVDIFDFAPIEYVATVEEQKQFYKDWIQSLKFSI